MAISVQPSKHLAQSAAFREWLFDALRNDYEAAAQRAGAHTQTFEIAHKRVHVSFAGEEVAQSLARALSHLAALVSAPPDLRLFVWDSSRGHKPNSLLLRTCLAGLTHAWWEFVDARGQLKDVHEPPLMAAYHPGSEAVSLLDLRNSIGLYWRRAEQPLPYYEAGSPFRTILHWWFRAQGIQVLHSAAIRTHSGGALLSGKGGSGKSTTALACVAAGLHYLGDDYCMVSTESPFSAFSIYNTCKLVGDADLARFPVLTGRIWNQQRGADEKATVFVNELWSDRLIPETRLDVILVPRVSGKRDTQIENCSRMEALTALAPTTIAQLPSADAQDLQRMKAIVQLVPVRRLELGNDLTQIPAAIEQAVRLARSEARS